MDICQLSIVIITFDRQDLLTKCLDSISLSNLPKAYEIILIINGPDAGQISKTIDQRYKELNIKVYPVPRVTNAVARNRGIEYASGEVIYFLDDDVVVTKNIFADALVKFSARPDIDVIGGPNLTPLTSNLFQKCSGYAFSSVFGAADMYSRYAASGHEREADDRLLILCNLAVRKKTLVTKNVLFAQNLVCAEENNLLYRLKLKGCKMLYCPQLVVYHERRKDILGFTCQVFKYGYGRFQHTCHIPGSLRIFHLLPSLFVINIFVALFTGNAFSVSVIMFYAVINIYFSIRIAIKKRCWPALLILPVIFLVEHFSYGSGFIYGLKDIKRCCKKRST